MKKLLLSVVITFSVLTSFSQAYDQADGTLNVQIMPGYVYNPGGGYSNRLALPAVMVSYDIGVHELVSIAPYAYYQHSSYKYESSYWNGVNQVSYTNKTAYNNFGFGVRGLFHFGNMIEPLSDIDQLDIYGGLGLGFALRTYRNDYDSNYNDYYDDKETGSDFDFEYDVFAGARWYFSDAFAVNAEVGYGTTVGKIGVTFKM